MQAGRRERFSWREISEVLRRLEGERAGARLRRTARGFDLAGPAGEVLARVELPAVLAVQPGETADVVAARADRALGREVVLLLRAGAAALGLWVGGELAAHKVFKRYVVRGHGRAQTAYLKTRGKSRYGSRLRLQNAQRLREEVGERLAAWRAGFGAFDRVFLACPVRLAADLPPIEPVPEHVPFHTHTPDHAELLRARWELEHGTIERPK